ncbi:MAG: Bug family tripartite tricarboxylate transporter substrate binding protein [Burkholderiales bacterium]
MKLSVLPHALMIVTLSSLSALAMAQSFPNKAVRLIVPFPAGGATDLVARTVAQKVSEGWKQPVVVENRAGAGGNIGADAVAKAAPDGYSILVNIQGQAISAAVYRKLPFDPVKDFTPVVQITSSYMILVGHPSMPATVKEVIALGRAQPGKINFGSTGLGAPPHLALELFNSVTGIKALHVPYKGDAPLQPALITNEVSLAFLPMIAAVQHIKAGKMRALGVTGGKRGSALPEVPSLVEQGLAEFDINGWIGVFGPAGMPRDLVAQIRNEFARATRSAEVMEKWPGWGYEPVAGTPEEFAAKYLADIKVFTKIVRDANIPLVD